MQLCCKCGKIITFVENFIGYGKSLVTDDVQYSYNKDYTFIFPDIVCEKGEHLLITGASGCGKTTLLHLIAGLVTPKRGVF